MSDRRQKRILDKEAAAVTRKAKVDMKRYVSELSELPSEKEIRAWQAGYVAGINRGANNK
jgi:hypothetical protein